MRSSDCRCEIVVVTGSSDQPKVVRVADELNFQPVVHANPFEDVMECLTKAMHDSIARVMCCDVFGFIQQ